MSTAQIAASTGHAITASTAAVPPVKFSKTPATIHRHAPRLGEHTAVLAEAGEGDHA